MKRAKQDSFTVLNIGGRYEKMFKVKSTYMFSLITKTSILSEIQCNAQIFRLPFDVDGKSSYK